MALEIPAAAALKAQNLSNGYKAYALALITAVFTVNILDRQMMGILLQPIKEDLNLSDTQLGFVTGIAFGLFYAVLGIPIARWADRGNRVTITSLTMAVWGLAVMLCLNVASFTHLALARIAAAVGEAGCRPPTYSLLGDYFPGAAERTRAMAIYWLAGPLAGLIGYIAGGWINEHYGWRLAFFVIGIPGLLLALVVRLTLVEPRVHAPSDRTRPQRPPPLKKVLRVLWGQRSCRNLTIALVVIQTLFFGVNPWDLVFMMRTHGMGSAELGAWWGLLAGASGIIGTLTGGYVVSRWFAGDERGQMRLSAITIMAMVLFYVAFLFTPQKHVALMMLAFWMLVLNIWVAPAFALMQRLVPDEMRATILAAIMLFYNLIGLGLGPLIVGALSDAFTAIVGDESLRYALLVMILVLPAWSAYHFWQLGDSVKSDLDDMARGQLTSDPQVASMVKA